MGRKKKQTSGQHPPIKGFRPGKEPAHMRKRAAKSQLGKDAPWGQKKVVDLVADKTPQEVRSTINRWLIGLLALALALVIVGVLLYGWVVWVGILVHMFAVVLFVMAFRLFRQRGNFEEVARMVGKGSRK